MDTVTSPDNMQLSAVKQLRQEMKPLQLSGQLDGYGLFVYGVVLRRLHLPELAIPALCLQGAASISVRGRGDQVLIHIYLVLLKLIKSLV